MAMRSTSVISPNTWALKSLRSEPPISSNATSRCIRPLWTRTIRERPVPTKGLSQAPCIQARRESGRAFFRLQISWRVD